MNRAQNITSQSLRPTEYLLLLGTLYITPVASFLFQGVDNQLVAHFTATYGKAFLFALLAFLFVLIHRLWQWQSTWPALTLIPMIVIEGYHASLDDLDLLKHFFYMKAISSLIICVSLFVLLRQVVVDWRSWLKLLLLTLAVLHLLFLPVYPLFPEAPDVNSISYEAVFMIFVVLFWLYPLRIPLAGWFMLGSVFLTVAALSSKGAMLLSIVLVAYRIIAHKEQKLALVMYGLAIVASLLVPVFLNGSPSWSVENIAIAYESLISGSRSYALDTNNDISPLDDVVSIQSRIGTTIAAFLAFLESPLVGIGMLATYKISFLNFGIHGFIPLALAAVGLLGFLPILALPLSSFFADRRWWLAMAILFSVGFLQNSVPWFAAFFFGSIFETITRKFHGAHS